MKLFRLYLLLLFVPLCFFPCHASGAANTISMHPGEVKYVRFVQKGTKLKLISASSTIDEQAQIILTMEQVVPAQTGPIVFKIVNKFALDLHYKAVAYARIIKFESPPKPGRVVAEKLAFEQLPPVVDELSLYAFELVK